MNSQRLNLFIVNDNPLVVTGLQDYLNDKFGGSLNISAFQSIESVIKMIKMDTDMVILDFVMKDHNADDVLKSIKEINSKTKVILLSSNQDVSMAIESFRNRDTDIVIKGEKAGRKIGYIVSEAILFPYRIIVKRFGIDKYLAMFLLTFVTMGLVVYFALKYIP